MYIKIGMNMTTPVMIVCENIYKTISDYLVIIYVKVYEVTS